MVQNGPNECPKAAKDEVKRSEGPPARSLVLPHFSSLSMIWATGQPKNYNGPKVYFWHFFYICVSVEQSVKIYRGLIDSFSYMHLLDAFLGGYNVTIVSSFYFSPRCTFRCVLKLPA